METEGSRHRTGCCTWCRRGSSPHPKAVRQRRRLANLLAFRRWRSLHPEWKRKVHGIEQVVVHGAVEVVAHTRKLSASDGDLQTSWHSGGGVRSTRNGNGRFTASNRLLYMVPSR